MKKKISGKSWTKKRIWKKNICGQSLWHAKALLNTKLKNNIKLKKNNTKLKKNSKLKKITLSWKKIILIFLKNNTKLKKQY